MSFRVLALCGAAGCGKDTAGHHLKNHFGFGLLKFAGPLKAGLCAMFGWPAEMLENGEWRERVLPDIGKSPRQLMQTLGTDWGRALVHPDLWMLLARRRIEEARDAGLPGVVFTDCRFANEAQLVKDMGGLVVHIDRKAAKPVAAHVSESGIPEHLIDAIVINDDSLEEFYACVRNVARFMPTRDVPSGTLEHDEPLTRCGSMSDTRRVCSQAGGHSGRHSDGIATWGGP